MTAAAATYNALPLACPECVPRSGRPYINFYATNSGGLQQLPLTDCDRLCQRTVDPGNSVWTLTD